MSSVLKQPIYKKFEALLEFSSGVLSVLTLFENDLAATVSITKIGSGYFNIAFPVGTLVADKTVVLPFLDLEGATKLPIVGSLQIGWLAALRASDNVVSLLQMDMVNALTDFNMKIQIEVRVYPS